MVPQEIIRKKRMGQLLTEGEIAHFFNGYLAGKVADYQVGAMLMAITLNGMTRGESAALTKIMRDSGEHFTWPYERAKIVDKHSTGGVGDKTSLLLLPLCILAGLKVPMIAGRGLGHTGGTLDKLEAVGWNVFPSTEAARRQMDRLGGIIMGQTQHMVPLDRKLYAMRDVTATVESIPLIVASILSKKLSEGIGSLVMDVKFGSGAFMQEPERARALAEELKAVGESCGIRVRCVLTDMDSPLGRYAGNALEVYECMEILRGAGPADTRELTLELATEMVLLARPGAQAADVRKELEGYIASGKAYDLFLEVAAAQGGDLALLEVPQELLRAKHLVPVHKPSDGGTHVASVDVRALGIAILELGGGRKLITDQIDPWVGLSGLKRAGESVAPGEPVAVIHANDAGLGLKAAQIVERAYTLGTQTSANILVRERL